ncbi:MAG: 16S rRNA (adenine(1518)-N(6)/adenine(1519)-N(6))-dimethyltransferase RsmA [bacterium]
MRARKRFGQHFLTDQGVLQNIVRAAGVTGSDHLLEIGPGQGALTELLADTPALYRAVEIDRDLVPMLRARFPNLDVIVDDILRVDLHKVLDGDVPWRLLGNLPYNISSPLLASLTAFVAARPGQVADMHFMLQREMAERLSALPGTKAWGRLSVMVQLRFDVEHMFDVRPDAFSPPPRVWSSIVRLMPTRAVAQDVDFKVLDQLLRLAFSGRRKRLSNSLKTLDLDWSAIDLDPGLRADNVSRDEYVMLARQLASRAEDTTELCKQESNQQ